MAHPSSWRLLLRSVLFKFANTLDMERSFSSKLEAELNSKDARKVEFH